MTELKCPYPEMIVDESSGVGVRNQKHDLWWEGAKAAWPVAVLTTKLEMLVRIADDVTGKR